MKINKISKILIVSLITFSTYSCSEKEIEPPNKKNVLAGKIQNVAKSETAMETMKLTESMAKIWDKASFLVNISISDVGVDGLSKASFQNSKWIFTYFSLAKSQSYVVTVNGIGNVEWFETSTIYKSENNISNFSIDSNKAMQSAIAGGLPDGKSYSMELTKNSKGMFWFVGSKKEITELNYQVKKVDALSGAIVG